MLPEEKRTQNALIKSVPRNTFCTL